MDASLVRTPGGRPYADDLITAAEVEAQETGNPLRLRLAATVLVKGVYVTWPQVTWTLDLPTGADVLAFRDWMTEAAEMWVKARNAPAGAKG